VKGNDVRGEKKKKKFEKKGKEEPCHKAQLKAKNVKKRKSVLCALRPLYDFIARPPSANGEGFTLHLHPAGELQEHRQCHESRCMFWRYGNSRRRGPHFVQERERR
jgi:hypothetical protein